MFASDALFYKCIKLVVDEIRTSAATNSVCVFKNTPLSVTRDECVPLNDFVDSINTYSGTQRAKYLLMIDTILPLLDASFVNSITVTEDDDLES